MTFPCLMAIVAAFRVRNQQTRERVVHYEGTKKSLGHG